MTNSPSSSPRLIAASVVVSVVFALAAYATTFTWTGLGVDALSNPDPSWKNDDNWDHGTQYPGEVNADDDVILADTSQQSTVVHDASFNDIGSLNMQTGITLELTEDFDVNGKLTVRGSAAVVRDGDDMTVVSLLIGGDGQASDLSFTGGGGSAEAITVLQQQ